MNYLIVIVGPTAVGKTKLCINLAQAWDTEIVSADSRQFYQEMTIGTAKPSPIDLGVVLHHFINSHSIHTLYTAGDYERDAVALCNTLFEHHDKLILTGGSGLYIEAITEGMADIPKVDPLIRVSLNERLETEGFSVLLEDLKQFDPRYYELVDKHNPQRIIRAIEVYLGTGKPYSFYRTHAVKERPFKIIKIGLTRDRKELYELVDERVDIMVAEGLFEEAKMLYPYREHSALKTVGYKEVFAYLEGAYDKEEAIRLIKRNTRRYAKRQITWFGKDQEIRWFHPDDIKSITQYIESVVSN